MATPIDFSDPLQAALDTPFSPPPLPEPRDNTTSHESQDTSYSHSDSASASTRAPELEEELAATHDDSWKDSYIHLLGSWREESATRRDAAEQERSKWEEIRKEQGDAIAEARTGLTASILAGDEEGVLLGSGALSAASPSPVDARDLVTGEKPGGHGVDALNQVLPPTGQHHPSSTHLHTAASNAGDDPTSGSQTWEQVDSIASSYPSLNYPDTPADQSKPGPSTATGTTSPRRRNPLSPHHHHHHHDQTPLPPPPPIAPGSVTLSIFDSSLSHRARVLALVSSLAINLLLPFINGVMLGFGEIFAKSVVHWSGWGNVASFVGLRSSSPPSPPARSRRT